MTGEELYEEWCRESGSAFWSELRDYQQARWSDLAQRFTDIEVELERKTEGFRLQYDALGTYQRQLELRGCTCVSTGPDENGLFDLHENPTCPIHGAASGARVSIGEVCNLHGTDYFEEWDTPAGHFRMCLACVPESLLTDEGRTKLKAMRPYAV